VGIVVTDRSGQITAANPAAIEIFGSPAAEQTKAFNVFTLPALKSAGLSAHFETAVRDKCIVSREAHYRSHWGREADISFTVAPLLDEGGDVLGMLAIVEDVTGRRRAEREAASISSALAKVGGELISSLNTPELLTRLCRVTSEVLECDRS